MNWSDDVKLWYAVVCAAGLGIAYGLLSALIPDATDGGLQPLASPGVSGTIIFSLIVILIYGIARIRRSKSEGIERTSEPE
ncbi:MAG: hypothetical protein ACW99U_15410 [Candidatus Thorarchaeota archaeon]